MRKILYFSISAAAALVLAGCSVEESRPAGRDNASGRISLRGSFSPSSRLSYGEAQEGKRPLTWSVEDEIGIFSYDRSETANNNVWSRLLSSSEGKAQGIFYIVDNDLAYPVFNDEKFLVYFPYKSSVTLDAEGILHSAVPSEQVLGSTNDHKIGWSGIAVALADVKAADAEEEEIMIDFTMKHLSSYIRFVVSSEELAGRQLKGVKLIDLNGKCNIAGDVAVDIENETVSIEANGSSIISASLSDNEFSGNEPVQEICIAAVPGDYSEGDWCVMLNYQGDGQSEINLPMSLSDFIEGDLILEPGTIYTVNMEGISLENGSLKWYAPSDSRDLLGKWAYGPQNTFYVESKQGEKNAFTFEVKGRGDITKLHEPKYYGLLVPSECASRGLLEMPDGVTTHETRPTREIGPDYSITVNVQSDTARGAWGTVAIYDEDYNILWSFMICKYHSGDPVGYVHYAGFEYDVMDRILGQPYSNAKSAEIGKMNPEGRFDGAIKESFSWAYFQWGRKDPFPWDQLAGYSKTTATNEVDIAYSIAHPQTFFAKNSNEACNTRGNWMVDQDNSLWGNENRNYSSNLPSKLVGHKTIYDPCPEGYRVADPALMLALYLGGERWELANAHPNQESRYIVKDNPFSDCSVIAYPLQGGGYDYWPYAGGQWCSNAAWSNRTSSQNKHGARYNCNANAGINDPSAPTNKTGAYLLTYYSKSFSIGDVSSEKATSSTLRCVRDEAVQL